MRRTEVNADSQVNAYGWTGLFNGFSGEKGSKMNPVDLLPYPGEVERSDRLQPRTKRILIQLIKDGALPAKAIGMALQIEEVRKALEDES